VRPAGLLTISDSIPAPANSARFLIFIAAVGAVVIVMLLAGWADDKASPGSGGRVPVTSADPNGSP